MRFGKVMLSLTGMKEIGLLLRGMLLMGMLLEMIKTLMMQIAVVLNLFFHLRDNRTVSAMFVPLNLLFFVNTAAQWLRLSS